MAKKNKKKTESRGKARMRAAIVEAIRGFQKTGAVEEAELAKITLRMLDEDALPNVTSPEMARREAGPDVAIGESSSERQYSVGSMMTLSVK